MEKIEFLILRNLLYNDDYTRKVLPFIKDEYFQDTTQRIVYDEISKFVQEYNELPTKEILCIELEKRTDLNEESYKRTLGVIFSLDDVPVDNKWLIDTTEKWCRDRAIYLALMESIHIADGNSDSKNRDAIPSILSDALAVSFDNHIGHDYFEDYEERFESYHQKENKLEFDLEYFNKITNGGVPNKTLNVFLGGTNTGKTLCKCHLAASFLMQSKDVLYITLEMSETEIAKRIDANILNIPINQLDSVPKSVYTNKAMQLQQKTKGTLIIKEYPTASAHSGHFKSLLNELALKKSFRPDVIFIDYINICTSMRVKSNGVANSYSIVKSIAEELRGLAVEFDVPIITSTQVSRGGFNSTDIDLTDTSECIFVDETVELRDGQTKKICDVEVGDQIKSQDEYKTVMMVHHKKEKECVKVITKSGKEIIVSKDHVFPTNRGRLSVNQGLTVGDYLNTTH